MARHIEQPASRADVAKGKHIASNIKLALVVPGSGLIKKQADIVLLLKYLKNDPQSHWQQQWQG
jgi:homoaconitase/3-isopropylmalate dehydratase large subunit